MIISLGSKLLVRQLVYVKQALLLLKSDLVSHPTRDGGVG